MKKLMILFVALALTITLTGCTKEVIVEVEVPVDVIVEVPIELPDIPTDLGMADLDDYLGRPDVQYVDLRNFDDKMNSGYVAGFEMIPFFDYLEKTNILVRTDGDWTFAAADIVSQGALRALFNEDKTIFLMCGSGTRAGFVLAALEELGYTDVINVGGLGSYDGDNLVSGDGEYHIEVQLPLPAVVDMANIDMYLGRTDVQYVDLRNFDDKMASGYIAGFEFIPFFDYLENTGILVRTDGDWTFAAEDIGSQGALRALFNEDKTIFLMCGSGTRAGYVMAALESLGYTDVVNVGGIGSYVGLNLVAGDGEYKNEVSVLGPYTPGVYFGYDPVGKYNATVVIGQGGGITSVFFDAAYGDSTKQDLGFDYNMKLYSGGAYEWFEHANMLSDFIVANQGWDGITLLEEALDLTWNAMTVPHHFITIDNASSPDAISGVTIGAEGFVLAWNAAISQATVAGTEGVVATTITPTQWAEAHDPYIAYTDGVFFGHEEGYTALITVEGGQIVDVFLDAAHFTYGTTEFLSMKRAYTTPEEYPMNYTLNDNGTPADPEDDFYELDTDMLDWWMQADALQDAIIEAQDWVWTVADGEIDGIAGVSIGVGHWHVAVLDALAQAGVNPVGEIYISEYIEGSGSNKALEIYNYTDHEVDLSIYSIIEWYNETGFNTYQLTGTLAAGEVLVLCADGIDDGTLLDDNCDIEFAYPSVVHFNGDDSISLLMYDYVIDQIGVTADAGGDDFAKDVTLVRGTVDHGNPIFDPLEWTEYAQDTFTYIGSAS